MGGAEPQPGIKVLGRVELKVMHYWLEKGQAQHGSRS